MSQKLKQEVLQRVYNYDDGTYILSVDVGRVGSECDIAFVDGKLHITISDDTGRVGELSVPVKQRIESDPELHCKNGIVMLLGKVVDK